jgi:deoxyribodipyrimidine photo-lyase
LPQHWHASPAADPLLGVKLPRLEEMPAEIARRWPAVEAAALDSPTDVVARLPIDHAVGPAAMHGGSAAASKTLAAFLTRRFDHYDELRNEPDDDAASGLSPYLHFGHLSAHEVFVAVLEREEVRLDTLTHDVAARKPAGRRNGWWGLSPAAEGFLDQFVTWRELGYHFCSHRPDYDRFSSLPDWARRTLAKHAGDPRPHVYDLAVLEAAATHDSLWNAAQRQLVREGRLHNYLRMLWGKKILEWSVTPEAALAALIELNNKYAVDGRDPNSYSGIFWTLGRFDRPWGPERPIFGTVRYMSSDSTARKVRVKDYRRRYGA